MVVHGDPGRRGTDHSESFGAQIKGRHAPALASPKVRRDGAAAQAAQGWRRQLAQDVDAEASRRLTRHAGVPRHLGARVAATRRGVGAAVAAAQALLPPVDRFRDGRRGRVRRVRARGRRDQDHRGGGQ
eukprot:6188975-Prymnesium_polylepis.1